jgi:hypothetical protein
MFSDSWQKVRAKGAWHQLTAQKRCVAPIAPGTDRPKGAWHQLTAQKVRGTNWRAPIEGDGSIKTLLGEGYE